VWNSLEVVKLVVSAITPLSIAIIGVYLNKQVKKFEHTQWRNQKLIEKRLAVYDELAPLLNDLLCYYTFVGRWKELRPPDIIKHKREVDKKAHLAKALVSKLLFHEIMNFLNLCFKTYGGWGVDAKMLTSFEQRKKACGADWDVAWEDLFIVDSDTTRKQVQESYFKVMEAFAHDLGLLDEQRCT